MDANLEVLNDNSGFVRCAFRRGVNPNLRSGDFGFRVVLSPFPL
jgi:hypothetical protein